MWQTLRMVLIQHVGRLVEYSIISSSRDRDVHDPPNPVIPAFIWNKKDVVINRI